MAILIKMAMKLFRHNSTLLMISNIIMLSLAIAEDIFTLTKKVNGLKTIELTYKACLQGVKYKIVSKISYGNFGITYLSEQNSLNRKVCIKEFFFRGFCVRSVNGSVDNLNFWTSSG